MLVLVRIQNQGRIQKIQKEGARDPPPPPPSYPPTNENLIK